MQLQQKKKVLVLCTSNSCRSQMAHGWLQHLGNKKVEVFSAGLEIHGLNPYAVSVMYKIGIDISHHKSKHVDQYLNKSFDYLITVCDLANENCPFLPGKFSRIHQNFKDPSKNPDKKNDVHAYIECRDEIKKFVVDFLKNLPSPM